MRANHPLKRLLQFARPYRRDIRLGALYSILNKIFDVLPELLIGVAVDVVVNQQDSFVARFGIKDPMQQLWLLVGLTVVIWACESLFEYLHSLKWRNLAQNLQHDLRLATYQHIQKLPPDFVHQERSGRLMAVLDLGHVMADSALHFFVSEAGAFVYDPGIQQTEPGHFLLFHAERKALCLYKKSDAESHLRVLLDTTEIEDAAQKYSIWRKFYTSTIPKISAGSPSEFPLQKPLTPLQERHRAFVERQGVTYKGVRESGKARSHRITHCYSCKAHLDNAISSECAVCGWILCNCGACGCGYSG